MIGKTISHYKIIEKLGEGGMGVVYKAEDTRLKRTVALKFLPPELVQSAEWKERFIREAQAAAALDHPCICHTYEIDEVEGQTLIAMAYVEGQTLSEKIASGPLDVAESLDIVKQVAEGLSHAHGQGIVHRDIKPANIMLDSAGRTRIMDFGLAKLAGKTRLTKTASVMGTVAYMSPEQARGDTAIDHRTDIWSLGVLLYEMLTGRLPFDAPTDAVLLYKILHEEPEPIAGLLGTLPIALTRAIEKTMQKDPRNRYRDMAELVRDLRAVRSRLAAAAESRSPSIAVLPFVDMSPGRDQEYFCDGMSEALINELTHIEDLKVIARTSAFSFKGKSVNVRDIGRELEVGTILEGSVQKAGNRLRITAQLVDTERGHHLWSERFDREMDDLFAIQDEITLAIVGKLKPKLLGEQQSRLAKRPTVDREAYSLCLKGRWYAAQHTEEGLRKAFEYYNEAIQKDPNCAIAYAGLAILYVLLAVFAFFPSRRRSNHSMIGIGKAPKGNTGGPSSSTRGMPGLFLAMRCS
jgi:serine/threonine protein kinase